MSDLRVVLSRVRAAHTKLKLPKCVWAAPSVRCLGNIVSAEGVAVDADKVRAVTELPSIRNVKALRSFLGMCNYYGTFVRDCATLASPFFLLTQKGSHFRWHKECAQAFAGLKRALASAPVFRLPDFTTVPGQHGPVLRFPFHLATDWSKAAMGAVLSQPAESGADRIPLLMPARF